jgi:hypothetical protein
VFARIEYRTDDHAALRHAHSARTAVAAAMMPTTAPPRPATRLDDRGERA